MLSPEEFQSTFNFLQKTTNETSNVQQLILYQFKWELKQKIGPKFFETLNKCSKLDDNPNVLEHFSKAVAYLHAETCKFLTMAGEIGCESDVLLHLKAILVHSVDEQTSRIVRNVYNRTFLCFYQLQQRGSDSPKKEQQEQCSACDKLKTKCICWALVEKFRQCNQQLFELDLLDRLAGDIVVQIAHKTVEDQVRNVCQSVFDVSHLQILRDWLENSILSWLLEVYGLGDGAVGEIRRKEFDYQRQRLLHYLHEVYAKYLIENLFVIIIDFPDSSPVVKDLKVCLEWVKLRTYLTEDLRKSLERRLLHPGVNTSDILTAYIQTVKTLKAVDPSGVLMDNVCQPVRQYLRSRGDTVRCIVSFLTESRSLDVHSDLLKNNQSSRSIDSDSDNEVDENWRDWCPDPIDAASGSGKRSRKSADIIGMLVEVYGSRESFVKEYSQLLAERLLRQMSYDIENELRYLELLKLRFGESELHLCEVMLKDVKDSQRIDGFVSSQESLQNKLSSESMSMSSLILSAQFWPQLKDDRLEWPEPIQHAFETYRKCYESLKASRTLDVKPNLGLVELELEFGGRTVEFCVSPLLACIIWLFQEKGKWTVEELAAKLKISSSTLKRRISWWSGCGVLKFFDGYWQLAEDLPAKHRRFSLGADDDEDTDALSADESDKEQQLEVYWTYITGLLKNLESLTAERIHNLLKMFGGQTHEGISLEVVHNFLQRKVRDQLLIHTAGVYKLPKK